MWNGVHDSGSETNVLLIILGRSLANVATILDIQYSVGLNGCY